MASKKNSRTWNARSANSATWSRASRKNSNAPWIAISGSPKNSRRWNRISAPAPPRTRSRRTTERSDPAPYARAIPAVFVAEDALEEWLLEPDEAPLQDGDENRQRQECAQRAVDQRD